MKENDVRIGVTGSRHDRPAHVIERLAAILAEKGATELHHGDCVGFDAQAHDVATSMGIKTVSHPPDQAGLRAFKEADEIKGERPYLDRNRDIVAAVDFLIAAPDGPERTRSGTWSTIRHAKRKGVRGVVLGPAAMTQRP